MSESPPPRLATVMVDVGDLAVARDFWSALLGVGVAWESATYAFLERPADGAVNLAFQRVPEARAGKNRVHVDLDVDDLDTSAARVVALGGSTGQEHEAGGHRWRVVADPLGNEFCLCLSAPA